ncbi:DUF2845 domain-containing protein [Pseudomonas typographi]|uniref:DUF2845 domain-containing protein n=1 Tax=Pseudomonas typographi TaxID=2715964 RepID=UPI001EEDF40A|nr:DUF2845 domain-containing protein [Pseudomonas typographi]
MLILLAAAHAQATLRCGTELIAEGAPIGEVQAKCGMPQYQHTEYPALRADGVPRYQAVQVTRWVYGPRNGAYRYLRFIEGKLVEIRTSREAP